MFWVMSVIAFRIIRGGRDEAQYIVIEGAEDLVLAPPQYTDEKVEAVDTTKPSS